MLALKVENLSKQYRLGQIGTGTLSHDLNRLWARVRGKEDPYAKIGATNDRTQKAASDYVWALKDINFEIEQGDAVGIIGRNGAGKSTLLKILSRTTLPTTGSVKVKGRIASLLEVGTGFHPEMTGRENIYQNGALLGMTRSEIKRKFDEIVDFSGCEAYIDTPVKRYSSGMYVRLAFAVAAHLESEILIVDEVLAVGDAEFQKKCLGKMNDVSKSEGRTVLFVSHNMAAVKELCNRGIMIEKGLVSSNGLIQDTLEDYKKSNFSSSDVIFRNAYTSRKDYIKEIYISDNSNYINTNYIKSNDSIYLNVNINAGETSGYFLGFTIYNNDGIPIISTPPLEKEISSLNINNEFKIKLPINLFKSGFYFLEGVYSRHSEIIDKSENFISFYIEPKLKIESNINGIKGILLNENKWQKNE